MHEESLTKAGKKIFPKLAAFADFYLAGGTALALQIGHRLSVDFDFVSGKPVEKNLLAKIKKIFSEEKMAVSVDNPDELTVFINDVKLTFLYYPFPATSDYIEFYGVKLLPVKEIAAMKAYAIGRRGSFRDYADLYFIISENFASLKEIIGLAEKKYGGEFNGRLFLEQVVYLRDIEDTNILFLKNTVTKEILGKFFIDQVKRLKF